MPRTPEVPSGAVTVTTYKEFEKYLRGFARGDFPFLWIVGRPGICKSKSIQRALSEQNVCLIKAGQITPIVFHEECWLNQHKPIVLDDAENLADKEIGAKQISALGEHEGTKVMNYATAGTYLEKKQIPNKYTTRSRLCVIANRWTPHGALQSRAMLVYFDPSPLEIHLQVGTFFTDQEVFDWIGSVLHLVKGLDVRMYNKACQMKLAKLEWKKWLLETYCHDATTHIVQEIEADTELRTRKDREKRFSEQTKQSRATYHRIVKRLREQGQLTPVAPFDLPKIDLSQNSAPAEARADEEPPATEQVEVIAKESGAPEGVILSFPLRVETLDTR